MRDFLIPVSEASKISERIVSGKAAIQDVDLLHEVASQIQGKCLCALGEFAVESVLSGIERFRPDFEAATNGTKST